MFLGGMFWMDTNATTFDIAATLLTGKAGARVAAIGRDILILLLPDSVCRVPGTDGGLSKNQLLKVHARSIFPGCRATL